MVGRAAPNDRLLLYRTVVAGEQGYRQGMLIAWPALGDWLDSQVIAPSGLGRAKVRPSFFPADALADETGSARGNSTYLYRHQFAEPFDAFAVELGLPELPGGRGTGTIHALAALLAAVTTIGLFAVYRMVAVVVQFAERRNRFVAAVSHELKTPLTSIRMYGEMLRDGLVADESKRDEYYRTITDESERLSRLIDNVLDFSRLEKGEYEVTPSSGNVAAIVEEVTAKLRPHAAREGFTIRVETETDRPLSEAVFDRDALTQVIFNLVDNALKYARGATRKEVIISSTTDSEGGGVRVSVRDFGPGIPAGDLARVFDAFYRAEDELTRTTKGTGIGLALVKELMESIGGSVCAENAEGGGLRVSLRLPRAASS
jgi:signal transduction histidine kinase